ncbi:hypothetical protein Patl1_35631 [Pistacia atlantica]|nr:hypothetical protein Patl1_35631 [Pistacia atlantica]
MRVPRKCSPKFYESHVLPFLNKKHAIQLTKFDYRLSNNLDSDMQKLRCRVNYHALRFTDSILEMGKLLVERMRMKSKHFIALHLRFQSDMLAFSRCYYGGGEKERTELGAIRKRWKGLHVSNLDRNEGMEDAHSRRKRYFGHKPTIRPNAKKLNRLFMDRNNMRWEEFASRVRTHQIGFMGEPNEGKPARGEFHENPTSYICEDSEFKARQLLTSRVKLLTIITRLVRITLVKKNKIGLRWIVGRMATQITVKSLVLKPERKIFSFPMNYGDNILH